MTDKELLVLLANEETAEHGFRLLVSTYGDRLYQHLHRMLNKHDDANDVLQNTLVKVFRNHASFKGSSKLYTWLYRIATNEALSFLAKQKRQPRIVNPIADDGFDWTDRLRAEPELSGDYIRQRLQAAIEQLPPKQRAVFSLRYFEEKSYQEMSDIFSTSVGSLKASYHHAVKKIERFLREV